MAIEKVISKLLGDDSVKEVKIKAKWSADRFIVKSEGQSKEKDLLFSNKGGLTLLLGTSKVFVPWHEVSHVEWSN